MGPAARQGLLTVAGGSLVLALVLGAVPAGAEEMRLAALTTTPAPPARSAEVDQAAGNPGVALGSEPAEASDAAAALQAAAPAARATRKAPKPKKHGPCVHGEWVSEVDYNPFTLSCTASDF